MAYDPGKNPFFTEEDNDYSFGVSRGERRLHEKRYDGHDGDLAGEPVGQMARLERIQQMKENSMNNQLDSTQRALASLYESEKMGIATAEELLEQGEKLDNVENKLDTINQDMKTTQKHLNNIKSVFGGIKNWWSGGSKKEDTAPVKTSRPIEEPSRPLEKTLETHRAAEPHPGMRVRGDVAGFYATDDDELDSQFLASGPKVKSQDYGSPSNSVSFKGQLASSGNEKADSQLEENLDMMSEGMSRLKGLAIGLGDEIQTQNDQVDRISGKADRADTKIRDQNRQMRKILGK